MRQAQPCSKKSVSNEKPLKLNIRDEWVVDIVVPDTHLIHFMEIS